MILYVDYDSGLEARLARPEVAAWAHRIRFCINRNKLRRICSTRSLVRAEAYAKAGKPSSFWSARFLASWSDQERALIN